MEVVLAVPVELAVEVGEAEAVAVAEELDELVEESVPVAPPHKKARSNNSIIRISSAMGSWAFAALMKS